MEPLTHLASLLRNALGVSEAAVTKAVVPQTGWKSTVFDSAADGKNRCKHKHLMASQRLPTPIQKAVTLKLATYDGKKWKKVNC